MFHSQVYRSSKPKKKAVIVGYRKFVDNKKLEGSLAETFGTNHFRGGKELFNRRIWNHKPNQD